MTTTKSTVTRRIGVDMISAYAENLLKVVIDDVDRFLRDDSIIDTREYFESVYEALVELEDELQGRV